MKNYPFTASLAFFFIFSLAPACAEVFRYQFSEGDNYRINSTVTETVMDDRVLHHSAEITNRITVTVSDVRPATTDTRSSAKYDCTFMTSEKNSSKTFSWGREYQSVFRRTDLGVMDITDEYFMPVVRNVPTFPERDIKKGETWTGNGEEAHDFRDYFGIAKPFKVPFTVTYTYEGPVQKEGKNLHLIQAEYTLFYDAPASAKPSAGAKAASSDYPVTTMGYSKQHIYWDNDLGLIPFYDEVFRIQLQLSSGRIIEYNGSANATVVDTKLMDRNKIVKEMNDEITRMGIKDTSASATENGVTLSLENIQFEADSPNLLPSEKEKIIKLAALLERYPDKELLISGHTALAGTAASRQKLSEQRAEAVARFLVEKGVRNDYNVYTRGFGAEKPIAPNDTEENRARNRRVEITILEK